MDFVAHHLCMQTLDTHFHCYISCKVKTESLSTTCEALGARKPLKETERGENVGTIDSFVCGAFVVDVPDESCFLIPQALEQHCYPILPN